jgi:hypothetical protein
MKGDIMETTVKETAGITKERLARLGLTTVAKNLDAVKLRARKMLIAYECYRYLTPEKILAFQHKLSDECRSLPYTKQLSFTRLADYLKIPPEDVLLKLEEAIGRNCFDSYEVAHIVQVKKDPLLLGLINGCKDKFFIAGWDNDVRISDLLKDNEG